MCLNCGCGELDTRHKETDLVREDVRKAAQGQGQSMESALGNLERSLRDLRSGADRQQTMAGTSPGGPTR